MKKTLFGFTPFVFSLLFILVVFLAVSCEEKQKIPIPRLKPEPTATPNDITEPPPEAENESNARRTVILTGSGSPLTQIESDNVDESNGVVTIFPDTLKKDVVIVSDNTTPDPAKEVSLRNNNGILEFQNAGDAFNEIGSGEGSGGIASVILATEDTPTNTFDNSGASTTGNSTGWNGTSIRFTIPAAELSTNGSFIQLTFFDTGGGNDCIIESAHIGYRDAGGTNAWDFEDDTQVRITFDGGLSEGTIPVSGATTSDIIEFDFDSSKVILIALDIIDDASHSTIREVTLSGVEVFDKDTGTAKESHITSPTGYTSDVDWYPLVSKIDIITAEGARVMRFPGATYTDNDGKDISIDYNIFKTIQATGQTDIVADAGDDILEVVGENQITITTDTVTSPQQLKIGFDETEVPLEGVTSEPTEEAEKGKLYYYTQIIAGDDANNILLIHSDTTNGSTTFTDSSPTGQTITPNGDAQHSTTQQQFGATSIYLDGTGDYLSIPDNDVFDLTTENMTIDFWLYAAATTGFQGIYTFGWNSTYAYATIENGTLRFSYSPGYTLSDTGISAGVWIHYALVRNGNTLSLYKNGTIVGSGLDVTGEEFTHNDTGVEFGRQYLGNDSSYFTGYLDEIRFSNVARWTTNFTPDTAPYGAIIDRDLKFVYDDGTRIEIGAGGAGAALDVQDDSTTVSNTETITFPTAKGFVVIDEGAGEASVDQVFNLFPDQTTEVATNPTAGSIYSYKPAGSGNDTYTKLLIHSDTTNGSTTFTDSSSYGQTITPTGVDHSTTQQQFGATSMHFEGNEKLEITDDADMYLGSSDFSIDFWIYIDSYAANGTTFASQRLGASDFGFNFYFFDTSNTIYFDSSTNGTSWTGSVGWTYDFPLTTWKHVELTRNGSNLHLFIDGTEIGTPQAISGTIYDSGQPVKLGDDELVAYDLNGYIDEFRWSVGTARHTTNFTPETIPYAVEQPQRLLAKDGAGNTHNIFNTLHEDEAGEIAGITEKTTPVIADLLVIEDSEDSNNKKKIQIGNLPGADTTAIILDYQETIPTKIASTGQIFYEAVLHPGNDTDTTLLIHSNTTDGSTTFEDSSASSHTVTGVDGIDHSDAQQEFGTTSIDFPDDGTYYLSIPHSTDLDLNTDEWTIDFWAYYEDVTNAHYFLAKYVGTTGWYVSGYPGTNNLNFAYHNGSSWQTAEWDGTGGTTAYSVSINTWHHIALEKYNDNIYLYVDGVSFGAVSASGWTYNPSTVALEVGSWSSDTNFPMDGYLDEIRISQIARYQGTGFTPEVLAYDAIIGGEPAFMDENGDIDKLGDYQTVKLAYQNTIPTEEAGKGQIYYKATRNPGNDANTLLLLHSNTTNGSTIVTDSSVSEHIATVNGDTQHSITQKYYGTTALKFDGTGDYLSIPDSTDWTFGSNDFTIDFWLYHEQTLAAANSGIISFDNNDTHARIIAYSGNLSFLYTAGYQADTNEVNQNEWTHIAAERYGNNVYLYVNGVLKDTVDVTGESVVDPSGLVIGRWYTTVDNYYLQGYIDELRISNVARYQGTNFTPDTFPYDEILGVNIFSLDENGNSTRLDTDISNSIALNYQATTPASQDDKGLLYFEKEIQAGNDADTTLLIHSNTTNGSTTFIDSSTSEHTVNNIGSITHATAQQKFGTTAIDLPDDGTKYLSIPNSTEHNIDGSTWTIDFWGYFEDVTNAQYIMNKRITNGGWYLTFDNAGLYLGYYGSSWQEAAWDGTGGTTLFAPTLNTWTHVALEKYNNNVYLYVDGVSYGSINVSGWSYTPTTTALEISSYSGNTSYGFDGYLDEIRISQIARYQGIGFTPNIYAYDDTIGADFYAKLANNEISNITNPSYASLRLDYQTTAPSPEADIGKIYFYTTVTSGNDTDTLFLLHSDTDNGSTSFTDSSASARVITPNGDAQHSTTQKYFGTTGISFDGTLDHLSIPDSADWDFGSGDFTIDFWMYNLQTLAASNGGILTFDAATDTQVKFYAYNGNLSFQFGSGYEAITTEVNQNEWTHIAGERYGDNIRIYVNGVIKATTSVTGQSAVGGAGLVLGRWYTSIDDYYFQGYLDEVRISKTARYQGTNFTPEIYPYDYQTSLDVLAMDEDGTTSLLNPDVSNVLAMNYQLTEPNAEAGKGKFYFKEDRGAGNDDNTVLLVHSDTTNGSTTFEDSSSYAHTITPQSANVEHSTAEQALGASSIAFNGSGSYLDIPENDVFYRGTGEFTIDFWMNMSTEQQSVIISQNQNVTGTAGTFYIYYHDAGVMYFVTWTGTTRNTGNTWSWNLTPDQWYHLAFERVGNLLHFYVDGTEITPAVDITGQSLDDSNSEVCIGYEDDTALYYFDGYLDEIRFSDTARYGGSNFTVASEKYGYPITHTVKSRYADGTTINLLSDKANNFEELFTEKTTPATTDKVLIEDSADSGNKKYIQIANLISGSPTVSLPHQTTSPTESDGEITLYAYAPLDPQQLLLIHSNTTDASTTFTDSSSYDTTITVTGDIQHDTAQQKFGTSSILVDSSADRLETSGWATLYQSDFTIDFWVRIPDNRTDNGMFQFGSTWNEFSLIFVNPYSPRFHYDGTDYLFTGDVTANTWYHIAIVRSGNTLKGYLNGSNANGFTIADVSSTTLTGVDTLYIGWYYVDAYTLNGWIDEFRISDKAEWTEDFTPPTAAYDIEQPAQIKGKFEDGTDIAVLSNDYSIPITATINVPDEEASLIKLYAFGGTYPGNDANTELLVHSDETAGSTTFTDSSSNGHTITPSGAGITHESTQQKYGATSIEVADGEYLSIGDDTSLDLGNSDFSIDFWVYITSHDSQGTMFLTQRASTDEYSYMLYYWASPARIYFDYSINGTSFSSIYWAYTMPTGEWIHLEVTRSSNNLYLFVNGVQQGTAQSLTATLNNSAATHKIGFDTVNTNLDFRGFIDEFRISNGVGRHTTNFTVEEYAYDHEFDQQLYAKYDDGTEVAFASKPSGGAAAAIEHFDAIALDVVTTDPTPSSATLYHIGTDDGGLDDYNELMIHSDTTNGSTIIEDTSKNIHTIAVGGDTQHSTTQKKFGATSIYFDGTGDYLDLPDHSGFDLSTSGQIYTIDFWFYTDSACNGYCGLMTQTTGGESNNGASFYLYSGNLWIWPYPGAQTNCGAYSTGQWNHVAVVGSSSSITAYLNGTAVGTWASNGGMAYHDNGVEIGRMYSGVSSYPFSGYIDEFRWSKGIERWYGNFTPPTEVYQELGEKVNVIFADGTTQTLTEKNTGPESNFSDPVQMKKQENVPVNDINRGVLYVEGGPDIDSETLILVESDTTDASTTFTDLSPQELTVTPNGDTQHDTAQQQFGATSILFDGNDSITVSTGFTDLTDGDFTIDFWARTASASDKGLFQFGSAPLTTGWDELSLIAVSGAFRLYYDGGSYNFATGYSNNTWHHVAIVKRGNTLKAYLDGVNADGVTIADVSAASIHDTSQLTIGLYYDTSYGWPGWVDEFRVTEGARWLTDFTPPTTPYSQGDPQLLRFQTEQGENIPLNRNLDPPVIQGASIALTPDDLYGQIQLAQGAINFTLPAVATLTENRLYSTKICSQVAAVVTVTPNAADRIIILGLTKAAGVATTSAGTSVGECIELFKDSAAGWQAMDEYGTWN